MASLEDIVASLTDRLRSLELKTKPFNKEFAPKVCVNPKAALPDKFDGTRRHFRGFINQLELVFQLQDKRYDTDRKKIATLGTLLTDKACPGTIRTLNSRNDMLHCESPVSLAAAMDQAIRIDNRIFERRQEQQYNPRSFRRNPPPNTPVSRIQPQQYQQRFVDNYSRSPANQPSAPITSTPVQQRRPLMTWISISLAVAL
ncbi:hypothetical protein BASA60_009448 [Batrachochytrium salamandrivorans]|nr:hypothetical protein BASA60_009448 [Batrachochytrium salamandrivorans]